MQDMTEKIIDFLSTELAQPPEKIHLRTRLRQDLGINGADAADILEAFSLTFDADIDDFRINDYFEVEAGVNPVLSYMLWMLGNGKPLKTLRVADLARAVEIKKLR